MIHQPRENQQRVAFGPLNPRRKATTSSSRPPVSRQAGRKLIQGLLYEGLGRGIARAETLIGSSVTASLGEKGTATVGASGGRRSRDAQ